ncbi:TSUP family transporter [Shewanella cyperi]|uniref:Probable membrane transporter protein n=1 Tax=Shewanella cyperi TaxID=2814292 RepID=A0A974XS01_9GAMM|nr:TSUP family transporter [Shewanella cyperi]QSX29409.1 TSUP family transporter [Shewanella cyperi]QSX40185.1 TSUP family transporter [Shewanella cyperi]
MPDLPLTTLLALSLVSLVAGFIDAISGGGGLISLPALMLAGLSPAQALATNKLQALFGKLSSVRYFLKQGLIAPGKLKLPLLLCFGFSALGALAIQRLSSEVLQLWLPWMIVAVALYVLLSPRLGDLDTRQRIPPLLFGLLVVPLLSFYDGFFGPASGSFFAIGFIALLGHNTAKATAHAKLFLLVSNAAALGAFILGGQVAWSVGIAMACGQWIGARYGSQLVHLKGNKLVKPMLLLVSTLLVLKLALLDGGVMPWL